MQDQFQREIDYLRISITDRCNLNCTYCRPDHLEKRQEQELLSFDEIIKLCEAASLLGVKAIRLTGGEPLLRSDCARLVKQIKQIKGIQKVMLTTNAINLDSLLEELIDAKLDGINISLDTLDEKHYKKITGYDGVNSIVKTIETCISHNLPVKINCVLLEESTIEEWIALSELAKEMPVSIRFIEMMPIGYGCNYQSIDFDQLLGVIKQNHVVTEFQKEQMGYGPAKYYDVAGFKGTIGFIGAMHHPFCKSCNRIRVTSNGKLKSCLFETKDLDLHILLSSGTIEEVSEAIRTGILNKPEDYFQTYLFQNKENIKNKENKVSKEQLMYEIGG